MITCQHARHLFDRYLDGELSSSLRAELHAHQLNCTECQSELAMLEACGDVVALDRGEPQLSASFTDRVLLARRAQLTSRPRPWGRMVLFIGSPLAAAASILLAVMLILPSMPEIHETRTASVVVSPPKPVQDGLMAIKGTQLSPEAERELERTPQMPAGFVDALLAPVVEHTERSIDDTRRNAQELELLLRLWVSDTNEKLVAQWRTSQHSGTSTEEATPRTDFDLDLLAPADLHGEPSSEPGTDLLDPL